MQQKSDFSYRNEHWPNLSVGDVIVFYGQVNSKDKYKSKVNLGYRWLFGRVVEKLEDHAVAIGITYKSTCVVSNPVTTAYNKAPDETTGTPEEDAIPLRLSPTGQVTAVDQFKLLELYESKLTMRAIHMGQELSSLKFDITWVKWDGQPIYTSSSCD